MIAASTPRPRDRPAYGAIDLGSNNCRLLVAEATADGAFRVIDSFSRITRLGEGVSASGVLSAEAMERTIEALRVCAERLRRHGGPRTRAVATQACRQAANGAAFLAEVKRRTGLDLEVLTPEEEARLAVEGCRDLLDAEAAAALVLDVGGGSTELSWLDLRSFGPDGRARVKAWTSAPLGVVTLTERLPEPAAIRAAWWADMLEEVRAEIGTAGQESGLHPAFSAGAGQLVGTSGAVSSLAGLHLRLNRYRRDLVDGVWMTREDCEAVARRLLAMDVRARATEPCVGPGRADLILPGAAILLGVLDLWPAARLRVADRGLREGMLLELIAQDRTATTPRAA